MFELYLEYNPNTLYKDSESCIKCYTSKLSPIGI